MTCWLRFAKSVLNGQPLPPLLGFRLFARSQREHPEQHLHTFRGALQADAYAGFNQLYKEDGRIQEVACWAHYLES